MGFRGHEALHLQHELAGAEPLHPTMVVQQRTQLVAQGVTRGTRLRQLPTHRQQRRKRFGRIQRLLQDQPVGAGEAGTGCRPGLRQQASLGHQPVAASGVDQRQATAFFAQQGQEADIAQQQQFEGTQNGRLRPAALSGLGQLGHCQRVAIEQAGVRVVARQQFQQQFVEVVARQQGLAIGHDMAALPLGVFQGAHFGVTPPAQAQRLQRQQHRAELGTGPLHAFGHESQAPVVAAEHLQNQAGFAPGVLVQHIGGFVLGAALFRGGHGSAPSAHS